MTIYFLKNLDNGLIKIGHSVSPSSRIRQIYVENQELLALMPGNRDVEQELHKRFSNDRMVHEWFKASDEILSLIESINKNPEPIEDVKRGLINFRMPEELNTEFENKIKRINQEAGRGYVLLHGDKAKYFNDAVRLLIREA